MGIFDGKTRTQPAPETTQTATPARPPMFGGFGGVKPRAAGSWINRGVYFLEVKKTLGIISAKPGTKGHEKFIAEFEVRHVVTEFPREMDPTVPNKVRFEASNKPGERVTYVQNVTKNEDMALGNIKSLFLAIAQSETPGFQESDATPEEWDKVLSDAIAPPGTNCAGTLVVCNAIGWEGKNNNWIVVYNWLPYNPDRPVSEQTERITNATRDIPPNGTKPPGDDIPY